MEDCQRPEHGTSGQLPNAAGLFLVFLGPLLDFREDPRRISWGNQIPYVS